MVHNSPMSDLAPSLIAPLAALVGAVLTAVAGFLTARERYSQRMERLAKVRESVSNNKELVARLDAMIQFELGSAVTGKLDRPFTFFGLIISTASLLYIAALLGYSNQDTDLIQFLFLLFLSGLILILVPVLEKSKSLRELLLDVMPVTEKSQVGQSPSTSPAKEVDTEDD